MSRKFQLNDTTQTGTDESKEKEYKKEAKDPSNQDLLSVKYHKQGLRSAVPSLRSNFPKDSISQSYAEWHWIFPKNGRR